MPPSPPPPPPSCFSHGVSLLRARKSYRVNRPQRLFQGYFLAGPQAANTRSNTDLKAGKTHPVQPLESNGLCWSEADGHK